ncbi:MAG: hypothetical protein WCT08_01115 [Patescibacteria group bacterium]|jgi:hypothetical protein
MQGIEKQYCDVAINAEITAWRELFESSAAETLAQVRYGKGDTLGLDAIPEICIARRIRDFDDHAIFVTEELDEAAKRRWPSDSDPVRQPLMFFCDPTDRSSFLKRFIQEISKGQELQKLGILMGREKSISIWNQMFEAPASITGATTSITCVRKGEIIFSVILNYITQTIFVASPAGVFNLKLPRFTDKHLDTIDLEHICKHGKRLEFLTASELCATADDRKRFVTFLGSPNKAGYRENFDDCMIFVAKDQKDAFVHHTQPGGPARILYLSELQKNHGPIGFIMANGEKIGEWIHWLAFVRFARNAQGEPVMKIFEVSTDRPWVKEGVLMSTAKPYSIFSSTDDYVYLDISRLKNFVIPSKFRSMLVVTPSDNDSIIHIMRQHQYREISI